MVTCANRWHHKHGAADQRELSVLVATFSLKLSQPNTKWHEIITSHFPGAGKSMTQQPGFL